jgi:hypothetical protein
MAKRKKAARIDSATEAMLLAEEDLAAMRPALAAAPDLVVQTLARKRKRRQKPAKKKVKARKSSARKARKAPAKKARTTSAKKARQATSKSKRAKRAGRT